jgi:hypothetical protein
MNNFFNTFNILAAITLFSTACGTQVVQAQPEERTVPKAVTYDAVLGKSVHANDVADFIASNNCISSGQFQLCQSVGLALWADADQTIKTAHLYISNSDDFSAYKGELPLGLSSNDTMSTVEQRFGQPNVEHVVQAGWQPGLPNESGSPDHLHYWAMYKRFGVTIVYNSPSANDTGATIHVILIGH